MKKATLFLFTLFIAAWGRQALAQTCNRTLLTDDFSNAANWQAIGSGSVSVAGSECRFAAAESGAEERIHRSLGDTLSDTYWKAETKLSLSPNQPGKGAGAVVVALTAGTLDFMSYDASQSYQETNQDGIGVLLHSTLATDNNRNNWYFIAEAKKGDVRSFNLPDVIFARDVVSTYYVRLERAGRDSMRLSVFTDSTWTTPIPGSPKTTVLDSTITNLTTLQHGTITPGTSSRVITGSLDNDVVCDDQIIIGVEPRVDARGAGLTAYPNPTNGILHVRTAEGQVPGGKGLEWTILDMMGRVVVTPSPDSNGAIDVSALAGGVYWMRLVDRKTTQGIKFQKL
jgi:hypothetical protein